MASGDAEQYRAIGVPRSSALLRFTLSSRTSPARTVRRVGCKTILCLPKSPSYTCTIHLQCPHNTGARDVPRHLVTTSTATCGCNHRVFETHTPCWRFKRSARGFRERCAFSSFDRCTPQNRSNSHAQHDAGMWSFASGGQRIRRDTRTRSSIRRFQSRRPARDRPRHSRPVDR